MNGARGFFPYTTGVTWRGWELRWVSNYWDAYNWISGEILSAKTHRGIRAVIKNANRNH